MDRKKSAWPKKVRCCVCKTKFLADKGEVHSIVRKHILFFQIPVEETITGVECPRCHALNNVE